MMSSDALDPLAAAMAEAALAAGAAIMAHYARGCAVSIKADASPVTVADHDAEAIILAALAAAAPGVPVIAEEETAAGRVPETGEVFFVVDPLDGTKEFVARNGEFTVNIALIEAAQPVLGVIVAPALGVAYLTPARGTAAIARYDPAAPPARAHRLGAQPIAARAAPPALVALCSRSHMNAATDAFLAAHVIAETQRIGSSLKFCVIAEGGADVYPRLGPTSEWDTGAGHAIVAAAGGRVETVAGAPLRYGKVTERYRNPSFIAWGQRASSGDTDAKAAFRSHSAPNA